MISLEFRFYHRSSKEYGNSDCKIEIHDGAKWLNGREISAAYYAGTPVAIGDKLRPAVKLLRAHGMEGGQIPLLLSRKQVHLKTPLPLAELAAIGWNAVHYPSKFGKVNDCRRLYIEAYSNGVGIDVSNIVSHPHTRDTKGLALKGLVDRLDRLCLPSYLYIDLSTWGWLKEQNLYSLHQYLESSCNGSLFAKVVTAPFDRTADDLMVDWANKTRQPQITRDELDEYDTRFDWLLHGAERGEPRIHKFFRKSQNEVSIPNFGLDIEIPRSF